MKPHVLLPALLLIVSFPLKSEEETRLYVVHFETGAVWQDDLLPDQQKGFKAHAQNLQRLRQTGQIIFGARYEHYGMLILAAENHDEARAILDEDPGVKSGLFKYRVAEMQVFYSWEVP